LQHQLVHAKVERADGKFHEGSTGRSCPRLRSTRTMGRGAKTTRGSGARRCGFRSCPRLRSATPRRSWSRCHGAWITTPWVHVSWRRGLTFLEATQRPSRELLVGADEKVFRTTTSPGCSKNQEPSRLQSTAVTQHSARRASKEQLHPYLYLSLYPVSNFEAEHHHSTE